MKPIEKLGLTALMTATVMAFVGVSMASATAVYNGATKLGVGAKVDFSLKPGTSGLFTDTGGNLLDQCNVTTIKMSVTQAGSSTTTTTGTVTELINSSCTFPTITVELGKGEIHHIASTTNATVTADAPINVTINTIFFGTCIYGVTSGTQLGTVTGGSPATFHASSVMEKFSGSSFACPTTGKWTGTYINTEPSGDLHFEAS